MPSSFHFLKYDYPELFTICEISEELIHIDPTSTIAKARLFSEKLTILLWDFEEMGDFQGTQVDRINKLYYSNILPDIVKGILHTIRKSGNKASHLGIGSKNEAHFILKKCFQLGKWFYETYNNDFVEITSYSLPQQKQGNIEALSEQLELLSKQVVNYKAKIAALNESKQTTEARKQRGERVAKNLDLSEKDTRLVLIDPQLRNAGWEVDTLVLNYKTHKTLPEKGRNMAISEWPCSGKWADYALFIGTTLYALVEAKKYASDISTDLRQSKIYAEKLEPKEEISFLGEWHGYKAPFLFSTNGRDYLEQIRTKSGVWFLDVRNNRNQAKPLRGWFSAEGLATLYKKNISEENETLQQSDYEYLQDKNGLGLRDYQVEAIKAIEDKIIQKPKENKALLVMATGTGKTRTVIGLSYRLIKANRFKRILFLTDRRLLAKQALGNYEDNKVEGINTFSEIYQIESFKTQIPDSETRIHFATVQSMVHRLFYGENTELPIDTYDCIIIDEAHRGYNLDKELDEEDLSFKDQNDYVSQYKRVIEYFDAYIVGLTATPALHTTEIFGNPVFSYSYRQAVLDGFLADHEPPVRIKTRLSEEGILWKKGERPKVFNPETNTIEELAALEDDLLIEIEQFNKLVITESFNREVLRELVNHIDPEGDEKTLIFAVRDSHADTIVMILKEEFAAKYGDIPQGTIEKITGKAYDPELLTKRFKNEKFPSIAVTVDLLTTGIDVPAICNLVFLRRVSSRILYEQMIGRATRKCDDIGKEYFTIYDAVRVHEALNDYTQMKPVNNPATTFTQLVEELDSIDTEERTKSQIEQIIAKIQRKRRRIEEDSFEEFQYFADGLEPQELIDKMKTSQTAEVVAIIKKHKRLWAYLDTKVYRPKHQLVSDHTDEVLGIERDYGNANKPEDYIDNFKKFIAENQNKIVALKAVVTSPSSLDRASLKELKLLLDQEGFNARTLNTAWKNAKNEDIAADIISFIRTLALDVALVPHEERINNAFEKVKKLRNWNKVQEKWLTRFQAQLLAETVLTKEDLDKDPFKEGGGYKRLNKIFDDDVDAILKVLNTHLYSEGA
ncbi:type I restriction-modification system endonuclease [Cochleicola gelatinilyticus]|uniref:Restriction endonuclease subunit R n=1 Tax=Cochleicola gelatinilyticus TaxID=1763537 RepID=A0A167KFX7_9FLAO|nr:type I restriction-modification system endonuclease [Cochleicola gelatinilyticus]OAB81850.1 restriction endonuclease subunit R [Cochleicola gelatinilyticus]